MKLYIHNLEIHIKQGPVVRNKVRFQSVHSKWNISSLSDDQSILVTDENEFELNNILKEIIDSKFRVFKRVTFIVTDLNLFKDFMINEFKSVPAAGGLVKKHGELLVIKRHGLWDIPKGKIEKGEKKKAAAIREVEEECGVKVTLGEKIGKTLHLYKMKGRYAFKYTHWYRMKILSERGMKPQKNEGIAEVRWMSQDEVSKMDTYSSITGILETYFEETVI
jgi:8-oxo-dGTP pyrophosphatase MutT (NUDIX family)